MYSFLVAKTTPVEALIKPESNYDFFVYKGARPVTLNFRGKDVDVKTGTRFGVRPSADGKNIRLIFPKEPTRVFTLTKDQARQLAKGVRK
jgi:hypothetical protein